MIYIDVPIIMGWFNGEIIYQPLFSMPKIVPGLPDAGAAGAGAPGWWACNAGAPGHVFASHHCALETTGH